MGMGKPKEKGASSLPGVYDEMMEEATKSPEFTEAIKICDEWAEIQRVIADYNAAMAPQYVAVDDYTTARGLLEIGSEVVDA